MNNELEAFARMVAKAEHDLSDATAAAEAAGAETAAIRVRLAEANARRESVRADLEAGTLDPRSAGGLLALADDDIRDLQGLIAEGAARQLPTEQARADAQAALDTAREGLSRAEAAERYARLQIKASMLDGLLMDAVAEMAAMGRAAGRGNDLASLWTPSKRLSQAIQLRVVPMPGRAL